MSIALCGDGKDSVKRQMQHPVILSEKIRRAWDLSSAVLLLASCCPLLDLFCFWFFEAIQVHKNAVSISPRSWFCLCCKAKGTISWGPAASSSGLVPSQGVGEQWRHANRAFSFPSLLPLPSVPLCVLHICKGRQRTNPLRAVGG